MTNKDTLKERSWKIKFTKKFSDNIVPGSVANDFIYLHKDCGKELMGFIETLIEQTRKERDEEIVEMIKDRKEALIFEHKQNLDKHTETRIFECKKILDIITNTNK